MTEEAWLPVPGYKGLYEVSSLGRVRSLPKKNYPTVRILKDGTDRGGYKYVYLTRGNNKLKFHLVHRLVAVAFHGEPNGRMVNHIDGNRAANNAENLEYVSRRENINHGIRGKKFLKGVHKDNPEDELYVAKITSNGETTRLGKFATEEEAHAAYIAAAREIGEDKYAAA